MEEKSYQNLSKEELKKELEKLKEELNDLDTEENLSIGGTGQHLYRGQVEIMRNELDSDRQRIKSKIDNIKSILEDKSE